MLAALGIEQEDRQPAVGKHHRPARPGHTPAGRCAAVFPTGTPGNATAIATGTYPAANGFVGNSLYDRALDPARPVHGGNHEGLLALARPAGSPC